MSNNLIGKWSEIERLKELPNLEELLLVDLTPFVSSQRETLTKPLSGWESDMGIA